MKEKMSDKERLLLVTILFITFIAGIILWAISDYSENNRTEGIGAIIIALILVAFGIKVIRDKYESIKKGEPFKDERSIRIEIKSAAYAFYIGIYWLLGLGIVIDAYKLSIPARSVPGIGIGGMAVIFGLSYLYLSKKGE